MVTQCVFASQNSMKKKISVIIPALDEEPSIGLVVGDIPRDLVDEVIVVDNGSIDRTAEVAEAAGAKTVREDQKGYGKACLTGIAEVDKNPPDIVVFLDGDYSDYPEEIRDIVQPILDDEYDFVLGTRMTETRDNDAIGSTSVFGNWLAAKILRIFWGGRFTDLGPFRAIRYKDLKDLNMVDENYGWTIEMQIKAVRAGLRYKEVPVRYRKRIGVPKITGTFKGSVKAFLKIVYTMGKYAITK